MSDQLTQPRGVYERKDDVQIVDVREQHEWDAGRIEGALHIPLNDLMAGKGQEQLDTTRPIAAICRTGNRSELATQMLRARGFEAHNVQGGMEAWESEGLPFSAPDGGPGRVA